MKPERDAIIRLLSTAQVAHSIEQPPDPGAFDSDEDYERAYEQWWTRVHHWQAQRQ